MNRATRRKLFSLLARKGATTLYYVGNKFARHGKPVLFQNLETARVTAKFMRLNYPALRSWSMHAREV